MKQQEFWELTLLPSSADFEYNVIDRIWKNININFHVFVVVFDKTKILFWISVPCVG